MKTLFQVIALWLGLGLTAKACDLCAIYSANNARPDAASGWLVTVSDQFIPYGTVQLNDRELPPSFLNQAFVDSSVTHLVPTWNFAEGVGVSLNVPLAYRRFKRFQLTPSGIQTESGTEAGLGDLSIIGRYTLFRRAEMDYSVAINLMAGVKLPTGDAGRLREEVQTTRLLDQIYGVGHQHATSGVHLRDLALGSGSVDGVFGVTLTSRLDRWFLNAQFQYYLRTAGESDYRVGDEAMVAGGPGAYLILKDHFTLSLQANATYDRMSPDVLLGRNNRNTGMSAWYLGPDLAMTWGAHLNANLGVDVPLSIANDGLQNVPDVRIHTGLTWRF